MTKIDETKQYKFSEIIAMVENKELPEGTKVAPNGAFDYLVVGKNASLNNADGSTFVKFNINLAFRKPWTIKLPKEDKYYLKAPKLFSVSSSYLQYNSQTRAYSLNSYGEPFTQSEIDAMPFDTNFFEKIKMEDD